MFKEIAEIYTYKFVGYGADGQRVYAEYITLLSITDEIDGIITDTEFTGRYIDCNGNQVFFFT